MTDQQFPPHWAEFGSWLKAERVKAGYTQAQLAGLADIHVTYLSKIENGRNEPPGMQTCNALADFMGIDRREVRIRARKISGLVPWLAAAPMEAVMLVDALVGPHLSPGVYLNLLGLVRLAEDRGIQDFDKPPTNTASTVQGEGT